MLTVNKDYIMTANSCFTMEIVLDTDVEVARGKLRSGAELFANATKDFSLLLPVYKTIWKSLELSE